MELKSYKTLLTNLEAAANLFDVQDQNKVEKAVETLSGPLGDDLPVGRHRLVWMAEIQVAHPSLPNLQDNTRLRPEFQFVLLPP